MSGPGRATRRFWLAEEIELLREAYPEANGADLEYVFERPLLAIYQMANKHGIRKSAAYLASADACRLRRGGDVGKQSRFQPGHVPANKGLRRPGWAPGRMRETQFKPGERSGVAERNWRPVGTVLVDPDGYRRIKVRDAVAGEATGFGNVRVWPLLQRHVWAQARGPIPAGHAIVFRDGDRSNCDIDNLECLSRQELMKRNSVHRWGPEMFEVIQLRGVLNRKLRSKSNGEKQNLGSA